MTNREIAKNYKSKVVMRSALFILLLSLSSQNVWGQGNDTLRKFRIDHSIYAEVGGPALKYSLNYDALLHTPIKPLKLSGGVGISVIKIPEGGYIPEGRYTFLPLRLSALAGYQDFYLEAGIVGNSGHLDVYYIRPIGFRDTYSLREFYFLPFIGLRYQNVKGGIAIKTSLSYVANNYNNFYYLKAIEPVALLPQYTTGGVWLPSVSIGYTFKSAAEPLEKQNLISHTLYGEAFGGGFFYSVNYDAVFHSRKTDNVKFALGMGLAAYPGTNESFSIVPIRIAALFGLSNHSIWFGEAGLNLSYGLGLDERYVSAAIGVRRQKFEGGLFFKGQVLVFLNDGPPVWPGVGVGYTFKNKDFRRSN